MNILIVEQRPLIKHFFNTLVENNYEYWSVDTAASYDTAVFLATQNKYDLFIFDYELEKSTKNKDSLSLGLYISSMNKYSHTPFVFGISYNEHTINLVNQLNCIYFLIKPYNEKQILSMIKKIINYMPSKTTISFKDEYGLYTYVQLEDIIYIKADRHRLTVVTQNSFAICTNHSLTGLSQLYNGLLVRCHRSYLINVQYITFIDKTNCLLTLNPPASKNTYSIKIGRKYIKSIFTYK